MNPVFGLLNLQEANGILPKLLVFLVSVWLLTRVWVPVTVSSKIELFIFLAVIVDIYRTRKNLLYQLPVLLIPLSFVVPLITFLSLKSGNPSVSFDNVDFEIIPRLTFFILVAWCLRYFRFPLRYTLVLFAISLLINIGVHSAFEAEITAAFEGRRISLGFRNSQWSSFYFGLLLIGILVSRKWLVNCRFALMLWLVASAACCWVLIVTETRAIWIAMAIVLLIRFVPELFNIYYSVALRTGVTVVVLVFFAVIVGLNQERIFERAGSELDTIGALFSDQKIPLNSIGSRILMWQESIRWVGDRPLTGWGGDGRKEILAQTEGVAKTGIRHFHNQYIDVLVAYGLLGLLFLFTLCLYPFLSSRRNVQEEKTFATLAVLYVFIAGLFESYLFFNEGVLILSAVLAPLLSRRWLSMSKEVDR